MAIEVGAIKWTAQLEDKLFNNSVSKIGKSIDDLGDKFTKLGMDLNKNVTLPIVGAGTAMVMAFAGVEKAQSEIIKGTGASGKELEGMMDIVKDLGRVVPQNFEQIGIAVAEVNTRFGATGEQLHILSKDLLDFSRITGVDVATAVTNLGRVFNALELSIEDTPELLDKLTFASQKTGIAANDLLNFIIDAGPAFEQFGFGLDESIALFSQFEAAGARPQEVISSLGILMTRMAREGVTDGREAMRLLIEDIKEAPTIFDATNIAAGAFGAKVGAKVAEDIRAGKFEIDDMVNELGNLDGQFRDTADRSKTLTHEILELKNEVVLLLAPLGKELVKVFREDIVPLMKSAAETAAGLIKWLTGLDNQTKKNIIAFIGIVAILGPLITIVGKAITVVGVIIKTFGLLIAIIKGAIAIVGAIVAILGGPLTLIILAVIAIITALVVAWRSNFLNIRGIVQGLVDWIGALPDRIRTVLGKIPDIFRDLFTRAKDAALAPLKEIAAQMNKLNPFAKSSPSLVDNITRGVREIERLYAGLESRINIPDISGMSNESLESTRSNQNITVNVDKVNSLQDVEMISRELGFKIDIA